MLELEVRGRAGVGKTTLLAHIAYCLRKSGYEVLIDGDHDPGELECLPPYFKKGQSVKLVEIDTTPMAVRGSSKLHYILIALCIGVLSTLFYLPLESALKILVAFVIALMVAAFLSGWRS